MDNHKPVNRREILMKELDLAIEDNSWDKIDSLLFRILFGLPQDFLRELILDKMKRYFPIIVRRYSKVQWMEELLENPALFMDKQKDYSKMITEDIETYQSPDHYYISAVYYFYTSIKLPQFPLTVMTAQLSAVRALIDAFADNVWIADDPEAGEYEDETPKQLKNRGVSDNAAACGVLVREWEQVLEYLEIRKTPDYPEVDSLDEIEISMEKWREKASHVLYPDEFYNNRRTFYGKHWGK